MLLTAFWLTFWLLFAFALGASVGSFLNVCVARLPLEKSLFWPASRCGRCLQPVRPRDNIPLVSYWLLKGRCRACGQPFSVRYFLVELFTALAFAGLMFLIMFANALDLPMLKNRYEGISFQFFEALPAFAHYAVLVSFLIVTSVCDLDDMEIPLSVTVCGTVVGLGFATLFPWPYPETARPAAPGPYPPYPGIYPWPVWYPLPDWLPAGSWRLGLATGLAGALAGMVMLRGVRFLFGLGRGVEGLGVGDADLMMMAGAFVGWQPVVLAFFVAVVPALFFGVVELIRRGNQALPFGPSLALGVVITALAWPTLGPPFQLAFFDPVFLGVMGGGGAVMLLVTSFFLRLVRGTAPAEPPASGPAGT